MSDHGNGLRPTGLSECTIGVENSRFERRAPVRGDSGTRPEHTAGTVAWAEFEEAWTQYADLIHGLEEPLSLSRVAALGGFTWSELTYFLNHEPTTWEPRT